MEPIESVTILLPSPQPQHRPKRYSTLRQNPKFPKKQNMKNINTILMYGAKSLINSVRQNDICCDLKMPLKTGPSEIENPQNKKTADSVLLSLFMRTNGKCNNFHAPRTGPSGILLSIRAQLIPGGPGYEKISTYNIVFYF